LSRLIKTLLTESRGTPHQLTLCYADRVSDAFSLLMKVANLLRLPRPAMLQNGCIRFSGNKTSFRRLRRKADKRLAQRT
jgi:hypothetical protein